MKTQQKEIAIIGGGPAGLEAAEKLFSLGYAVSLLEKEPVLGGKIRSWHKLFPDNMPADQILNALINKLNPGIHVFTKVSIVKISCESGRYYIYLQSGAKLSADAILLTLGYDLFNPQQKEEYGYGIYNNVITAAELELQLSRKVPIVTTEGKTPARIAFVHCVGSRDEKAGIKHCSSMCCVTGVKQAIELKKQIPSCEIFMFYMDLRMHGRYYEDLYLEAQAEHHIRFIRGRLSEASENPDGSLALKADDTLAGNPIKMSADLLVLLTGFIPSSDTPSLAEKLNISLGSDGFYAASDTHLHTNTTQRGGVFVAGTCTGPKSLEYTLADARSAVLKIHNYFSYAPLAENIN